MIQMILAKKSRASSKTLISILRSRYPDIVIKYNSYGKMLISHQRLFVSISHSGEYIVMCYATMDIGIDIQKVKKKNNEFMEYVTGDSAITEEEFTKIWSIKESFVKLLGLGWSNNEPEDVQIDFSNNCVLLENRKGYFSCFKLKNNYFISVCCYEPIQTQRVRIRWEIEYL